MYQISARDEHGNVEDKRWKEFVLDFFAERPYEPGALFLAKMLSAPNRTSQELPLLALSVAIYGLVLAPLRRGG
jgi:hypothetical protein